MQSKKQYLTLNSPPLTDMQAHDKLLPLHSINNTSINNTHRNEKHYLETRLKQSRSKALFYNWYSVKNRTQSPFLNPGVIVTDVPLYGTLPFPLVAHNILFLFYMFCAIGYFTLIQSTLCFLSFLYLCSNILL